MIRTLDAAALRAQYDPVGALEEHPWLGAAIDADVAAGRFGHWGASTVVDENTGSAVLSRAVFDALHDRAGLPSAWPVGNAGLLHVYGYLLSTTPTPYGLKRDRWIDGALARAYGLAGDEFVPWARRPTLLARVTQAADGLLAESRVRVAASNGAALALGRALHEGPWALAYAVEGRLITTFPVVSSEVVLTEWDAAPDRLRWNAHAG